MDHQLIIEEVIDNRQTLRMKFAKLFLCAQGFHPDEQDGKQDDKADGQEGG